MTFSFCHVSACPCGADTEGAAFVPGQGRPVQSLATGVGKVVTAAFCLTLLLFSPQGPLKKDRIAKEEGA